MLITQKSSGEQPLTQSPMIAIVDDEFAVRQSLSKLFETSGYVVNTFSTGKALLEAFDLEACDCVIADMVMPMMTGFEMFQEMQLRGYDIPMIFISGDATIPMATRAIRQGAFDFVQKPLAVKVLLKQLSKAVVQSSENKKRRRDINCFIGKLKTLTAREREIFELVVQGDSCAKIAHNLYRSEKTIKLHRAHLMKKMGFRHASLLAKKTIMIQYFIKEASRKRSF